MSAELRQIDAEIVASELRLVKFVVEDRGFVEPLRENDRDLCDKTPLSTRGGEGDPEPIGIVSGIASQEFRLAARWESCDSFIRLTILPSMRDWFSSCLHDPGKTCRAE